MGWDSLLQGRNVHSSMALLTHLPHAERVSRGEIKGSHLLPSKAGGFISSPRTLDLVDAVPQAVL